MLVRRRDLKAAAFFVVEQGGKDAWRIKAREAEPIDRALHADERNRPHVADDAVIFNRLITHSQRDAPSASIRLHEGIAQNVRKDEKTILEATHIARGNEQRQFDQLAKLAAFTARQS